MLDNRSREERIREALNNLLEEVTEFLRERNPDRKTGPTYDEFAQMFGGCGGGEVVEIPECFPSDFGIGDTVFLEADE